jgi:hypothetical protein
MTELELEQHLRIAVNSLQNQFVTLAFEIERNQKKIQFEETDARRGKKQTRTDEQRFMHADCLLLEYLLVDNKTILEPIDILHDFRIDKYAIDAKCISGPYFWPTVENIKWMRDGIRKGLLTHFLFHTKHGPNRILKEGDSVSFNFVKLVRAQDVLDNLEDYTTKDGRETKRYRVL